MALALLSNSVRTCNFEKKNMVNGRHNVGIAMRL